MVLNNITFYPIFGIPLIVYGGVLTFLLLIFAATLAILHSKGVKFLSYEWHPRLAITGLALAVIHAVLGILSFVK